MSEQHPEEHRNTPAAEAAVTDSASNDFSDTYQLEDETTRKPRRWRRWAIGAVVVAVLGAAGLFALTSRSANGDEAAEAAAEAGETEGDDEAKDEKAPVPVELAAVESGDVASYITATTNLVAEGEVMVLSEVEGRAERVAVDEGSWVRKGQILAVLARQDAEIALEKTRVREANAKTVYDRGEMLSKDELISAEDLDRRRLDYELARQERAEAEWILAKTEIRAPIDGRVSLRQTQPGQHLRPGDPMFQITDSNPLIARIYLPEKDVLALDAGRTVEMSLDAAPDVTFTGRIRQISPVVDTATGTVKLTLEVSNPPSQVRPGSFVTARVVRERHPDVLVLPREAVLRELKQAHVFVAQGDGDEMTAVRRAVTLGIEETERVEVSGLEAGERVVVAGQGSLSDGARIRELTADQEG
ncbi:MAG TPA: efflux RND transporter periplasmic adaptor subunit [Thermoanaerobaculia bacterium]|nr:efflux RND transporter periplasmic adaptor subunit [Thermoanaerobaculia bacterium]